MYTTHPHACCPTHRQWVMLMSPLHRPLPHDPRSSQPVCGPRGDSWGHTLLWVTVTCIHCPPPCTAEGHSWKGPSPPPHASWLVARDMCYMYMLHGAIPVGPLAQPPDSHLCQGQSSLPERGQTAAMCVAVGGARQQPCMLGEVRQLQHTAQVHERPDRRASRHTCNQAGGPAHTHATRQE